MAQPRHNVRSTKPNSPTSTKLQARPASPPAYPSEITNEVHIWETPISKPYSDDTGRFTVRLLSGKWYVMIIFHCDSNTILQTPFKKKSYKHRLDAYNSIRGRFKYLRHTVDLKILYNEFSTEYKWVITEDWVSRYQLVPPDMYLHNEAECAICTFKAHFLATLAGICAQFPRFFGINRWNNLS